MAKRPIFLSVLLAIAASGATCKGNEPSQDQREGSEASPAPAAPPPNRGIPPAVTQIAGIDLRSIEPSFRADALRLLNETYCYCGCARTIAACLANRADCSCVRCSERMANFIMREYKSGASTEDVEIELLQGFSEGFTGKPIPFVDNDQPAKGPKDAPITLAEFADFRCPHCAATFEVLERILKERKNVRLKYYYFPLGAPDSESQMAAEAAEEARVQGKFWEMATLLFRNQHNLKTEDIMKYAQKAGLNLAALKAALTARTHKAIVLHDRKLGKSAGIVSTPTIYVNGRRFGLSRSYENIALRLDMEAERPRCD